MRKYIDVLVDLQFGSTGKGALAGYLSEKNKYEAVISCNMPNAGHTAYDRGGNKWVHKVLPSGIFSPFLKYIMIGPGAVFSIDRLIQEWAAVCDSHRGLTLVIHEDAGILKPEHAEAERAQLSGISSTMQGSAAALVDKLMRKEGATARYYSEEITRKARSFGMAHVITSTEWVTAVAGMHSILAEGSQGYSLGLNAGFYPYCTSRDCTSARVLSDCSLPLSAVNDVYGSCRTYPIRVGNTADGNSGGWYDDQGETSWEALGVIPETTTVTGRVRRVATFSMKQIREAMLMSCPTKVFLNFCNYNGELASDIQEGINSIGKEIGSGIVAYKGWGPSPEDIEEVL